MKRRSKMLLFLTAASALGAFGRYLVVHSTGVASAEVSPVTRPAVATAGAAATRPAATRPAADAVAGLKGDFFNHYVRFEPEDATFTGYHPADGQLKDLTAPAVEKEVRFYEEALRRAASLRAAGGLSPDQWIDLQMMEALAKYKIHYYACQRHLRNANMSPYPIKVLSDQMVRADRRERWQSIAARVGQIPGYLTAQQGNLAAGKDLGLFPNRYVYEQVVGSIKDAVAPAKADVAPLFTRALPEAAKAALKVGDDDEVVRELRRVGALAEKAYAEHLDWLEANIAAAARKNEDFALGRAEYLWLLRETFFMPETTPEDLACQAKAELKAIQKALKKELSQRLNRPVITDQALREAIDEIRAGEPKIPAEGQKEKALQTYKDKVKAATQFMWEKDLVRRDDRYHCDVIWMPPGLGGIAPATNWPAPLMEFADQPGQQGPPGFFLVDENSKMAAAKAADLTVHEALPGHYLQSFVWQSKFGRDKSPVRFFCVHDEANLASGNWSADVPIEGWALYAEQLMLEKGFFTDPDERIEAWVAQALRAARVVIDVGLHADNMTIEEAEEILYTQGLDAESKAKAHRDVVNRYAVLPTQAMCYLIGRKQIEQLRADWQRLNPGEPLSAFHDEFLSYGPIPPTMMRQSLLRSDSPAAHRPAD